MNHRFLCFLGFSVIILLALPVSFFVFRPYFGVYEFRGDDVIYWKLVVATALIPEVFVGVNLFRRSEGGVRFLSIVALGLIAIINFRFYTLFF